MSLVTGSVMEGLQANIVSVNMNNPNWRDTIRAFAADEYVYVLEDRAQSVTTEKILKAGSTKITLEPDPQQPGQYRAKVPDRLDEYRTSARAGRQLSLHFIRKSDLPAQYDGEMKSAKTIYYIEREWLRKKLYLEGNGKLLEWDHTQGDWRSDDHAWNADTNNK